MPKPIEYPIVLMEEVVSPNGSIRLNHRGIQALGRENMDERQTYCM